MALSAANTTLVFEIFCIPQGGLGYEAGPIATLYGAFGEAYDFSALVTQLNTKLTALTSTQQTRCETILTNWEALTSYGVIKIHKASNGAEGTIVNYPLERKNMRAALSNIIGFAVPGGGFMAEVNGAGSNGISR